MLLIFAPKHFFWVHIGITSESWFQQVPARYIFIVKKLISRCISFALNSHGSWQFKVEANFPGKDYVLPKAFFNTVTVHCGIKWEYLLLISSHRCLLLLRIPETFHFFNILVPHCFVCSQNIEKNLADNKSIGILIYSAYSQWNSSILKEKKT